MNEGSLSKIRGETAQLSIIPAGTLGWNVPDAVQCRTVRNKHSYQLTVTRDCVTWLKHFSRIIFKHWCALGRKVSSPSFFVLLLS